MDIELRNKYRKESLEHYVNVEKMKVKVMDIFLIFYQAKI